MSIEVKQELTSKIFTTSHRKFNERHVSIKQVSYLVWAHPTSKTNMRLTHSGSLLLDELGIPRAKFKLEQHQLVAKTFSMIGKRMVGPFYISTHGTLLLYDEKDTIMVSLLNGDLRKYLESHNFS